MSKTNQSANPQHKEKVMPNKKALSPEKELEFLCDLRVMDSVAHVSEFSPGTEYFDAEDAETMIKFLSRADLTGLIIDGLASVHRPGILDDRLTWYNKSEEEMVERIEDEKFPRHEHVHWMFNELMKINDEWLGKFRAALPKTPIVYSIDSDDFHSMCERMLRVIVQSGKVKAALFKKNLEVHIRELRNKLNGLGTLKVFDLEARLRKLEEKRGKQMLDRASRRIAVTEQEITAVKADIALIKRRDEFETKLKVFQDAVKAAREAKAESRLQEAEKRLQEADSELVKLKVAIGIKEQGLIQALSILEANRETLVGIPGKQKERSELDNEIKKSREEIVKLETRLAQQELRLKDFAKFESYYREPETSPVYQRRVAEHVRQMYKRFYKLGTKHDIRIVTKPDVLVFGSLVIDYAHDRGRTWQPMPGRVKKLAEAYHGLMTNHRENIKAALEELKAPVMDLDVVLESGHHGVFFARWQKLNPTTEEIRMQHVNTFYTGQSDGVKHVTYIAGMPFEAQDKIVKYMTRRKPARTRGGKPIASASHPVFIRNMKRSVSGLTIIRKHQHGFISVEPIAYGLFRNKQVLEPFRGIMAQNDGDNHLNSPEVDLPGTVGTFALNRQLMKKPFELYGQKVHLGGTKNLGDTSEANSKAWKEATKYRRPVMESLREIMSMLTVMNPADFNSVHDMSTHIANHLMGGANENMRLNQLEVLWFLKEKFLSVYHESPARLRDILATLEGNHFANAVRDVGIKEFDSFEDWLLTLKNMHEDFPEERRKAFPLQILVGGKPRLAQPSGVEPEIVVHLGGYSSARQGLIERYGVGFDGKLLVQKTYRIVLTHEPNAFLNKVRNADADEGEAGHTHESHVELDKSGDNVWRVLNQTPCTQRVSATELSYGGLPRTAGVDLCVYTQPGRFFKMTIPMSHMRRIGMVQLKIEAKEKVEKKKK